MWRRQRHVRPILDISFGHATPDAGRASHLLDAEAEIEEAVRGVGLPVRPFDLVDEAAESVAQLSRGALEDVLVQHHRTGWKQQGTRQSESGDISTRNKCGS